MSATDVDAFFAPFLEEIAAKIHCRRTERSTP